MGRQRLKGYLGELLRKANAKSMLELPPKERAEARVLLTIPGEEYGAAQEMLEVLGYQHIYRCAWKRNDVLKQICYDVLYGDEGK